MSKKIAQRDINLARKLVSTGAAATNLGVSLLDNDAFMDQQSEGLLKMLEEKLFDCISACRDYRRKVSPIEVKGQRA